MDSATLQVRSRLRVRASTPTTAAAIVAIIDPGTLVTSVRSVSGDTIAGNALWYELDGQRFVWSGGCLPAPAGVTAPDTSNLPVGHYPNGRIKVLDDAGIRTLYGSFNYTETSPRGAIKIEEAWTSKNIVTIDTPLLINIGHPHLEVNTLAADAFQRVFDSIGAAGLRDSILTCGGTYVARHKTWDPSRSLSSHSWGIAIDLNVRWNSYGATPAPLGAIGSVRELIPYFAAEGFGWGGDFTEPDGMHFELALTHY